MSFNSGWGKWVVAEQEENKRLKLLQEIARECVQKRGTPVAKLPHMRVQILLLELFAKFSDHDVLVLQRDAFQKALNDPSSV